MKKKLLTGIAAGLSVLTIATPTFAATVNTNSGTRKVSDTTYNDAKNAFNKIDKSKALKELEAAKKDVTSKQASVSDLNKKVNDTKTKISKLETATKTKVTQAEVDALKKKEAEAKTALTNAQNTVTNLNNQLKNLETSKTTKENNIKNYQSKIDSYTKKLNEYNKKADTAQSNLNKIKDEYLKRDKFVNKSNGAYKETAEYKTLTTANNNLTAANKNLTTANNNLTTAKKNVTAKEKAYNDKLSLNNEGIIGYYRWVRDNYPAQKQDAQAAIDVLNEERNVTNKNIVKEYKKDVGDSTALDNVKYALTLIPIGNNLRIKDDLYPGRTELKVTHNMMAKAQAQLNATVVYWKDNHALSHSKLYPISENLASGYDNPFVGWYTEEKDMLLIGEEASMEKYNEYQVGHYLSLVDGHYEKQIHTTTGMAWTPKFSGQTFGGEKTYVSGNRYYPETDSYVESALTIGNYTTQFNKYYDSVNPEKAKTEWENAKKDLTNKEKAVSNAKTKVTEMQNAKNKAQATITDLENKDKYNTLKNKYSNLEAEIKTNKEGATATKAELDQTKSKLNSEQNSLNNINKQISDIKNKITNAKKAKTNAQNNYNAAVKNRQDKEKALAAYNKNVKDLATEKTNLKNYQKQLAAAQNNLNKAKDTLAIKQKEVNKYPTFEGAIKKKITDSKFSYLNDYIDKMLASKVGWKNENGKWRYYSEKDGKYYTGWKYMGSVEGEKTPHWSYFGKDGYLYTGWHYMSKTEGEKTPHWSYFGPNGWLRTGWQTMGTKQNPDGKNKQHMSYFGSNGWLRTGWVQLGKGTSEPDGNSNKHWSYFGSNGWLRTGWVQLGKGTNEPDGNKAKHWSYFGNNGWLRTGLQNMGKGTSNPDGNAAKHQSYFGDNGWLVTNKTFSLINGNKKVKYASDSKGWITPI